MARFLLKTNVYLMNSLKAYELGKEGVNTWDYLAGIRTYTITKYLK